MRVRCGLKNTQSAGWGRTGGQSQKAAEGTDKQYQHHMEGPSCTVAAGAGIVIMANNRSAMLPLGYANLGLREYLLRRDNDLIDSQSQPKHASSQSPGWLHHNTEALEGLKLHIRQALQLSPSEDGELGGA